MLSKKIAGSAELFFRKHGPAILTAAGVGGFAVSSFLTGRAALKAQKPVEDLRRKKEEILDRNLGEKSYRREGRKRQARDLLTLYREEGVEILKIYAPAVTVGAVSVFCVIASHGMMRSQRAALAAAYTALDTGFRTYRKSVQEELGPEKEMELYRRRLIRNLGERREPEEGEEGFDPNAACDMDYGRKWGSQYARFFDETNVNWTRTPEYNKTFLLQKQNWLNDKLRAYGFVFLNEVYQELGFERTQAGQSVGWRTIERGGKDGFIDFGIFDIFDESSRAFVNGLEGSILLDFNVDGPITI